MAIMGLDISRYQEYIYPENPEWNKYIDWDELKKDPLNFRFIWIKVAEGLGISHYPLGVPKRQVLGAKSVNFEAINGYHFHYYQEYLPLLDKWQEISPSGQAKTFHEACTACLIPGNHPMTDCEDPSVGQFLVWTDTPSANAALEFALKLNEHLRVYHLSVHQEFGQKPDIYTGAWWWNRFGRLILQHKPQAAAWWKLYKFILADYDGQLTLPDGFTSDMVIAWQKTSSPVPPVMGIPSGRVVPGDALDIDVWMQSEEEYNAWIGKETNVMPAIHVVTTKQSDRARLITLEGTQKFNVPLDQTGVDAIILPMGGMDRWEPVNGHMQHYVEETFQSRCDQFAQVMPVLGMFRLSAEFFGKEQYSAAQVDAYTLHTNPFLGQLINAWHDGPWTMDKILAKQSKWHPLSALILSMTETGWYANGLADASWQYRTYLQIAERVKGLQDNGCMPKIPVIMYTGPWWLYMYDKGGDFTTKVLQSNTYKSWHYLMLGQWVRKNPNTLDNLNAAFQFLPEDSFTFKHEVEENGVIKTAYTYPDGYFNRILCHEFSGNVQKVKTITDASGNLPIVKLSLWCDTKEKLYEFLSFTPGTSTPPPNTEPLPSSIEEMIKTINANVAYLVDQYKKHNKEL